jgi:DNA polymerase III subunit epsilon
MFDNVSAMLAQRSFDDLGTPLADVTFCVVDLETTGGSVADCAITEIGALKVRRGEPKGSFHTLVNPGHPVPAFIRLLTGISDDMLVEAPGIESVLPSFVEFVGGCVFVAHNARFDVGFLNAALQAASYEPLGNPVIDTAALARRLLAGEVPNHKLNTLSTFLRCPHQPCHRAYADVLATTDVLHCLIERVAGFGVTTLEDLMKTTSTRMNGTFSKITLADGLVRGPGIYRFIGHGGRTLYVGKAADVRSRVRSYFYGDPRRRIRDLLRETEQVRDEVHATMLEAEVAEARAIARERPPYNRAGKTTASWYLKVAVRARVPKLCPARRPRPDGSLYVGPFPSMRAVRALIEALRDAAPIHRCSEPARCKGCAFSEMQKCSGPDRQTHRDLMRRVASALVCDPNLVLAPLERRMWRLASRDRFEEAAETRDKGAMLERTLARMAEVQGLIDAGEIVVALEQRVFMIKDGQLAAAMDLPRGAVEEIVPALRAAARWRPVGFHITPDVLREARVISSSLARGARDVRLIHVDRAWAVPSGAHPTGRFSPTDSYAVGASMRANASA